MKMTKASAVSEAHTERKKKREDVPLQNVEGRIKSCLKLSMCPELDSVDKDANFVKSSGTTSK